MPTFKKSKGFQLRSGNTTPFKQMAAIDAIKQVKPSSTGYSTLDEAKMKTEKEIYLAKLRGDYQDLTGDKLKKASYEDITGHELFRGDKSPMKQGYEPRDRYTPPKDEKIKKIRPETGYEPGGYKPPSLSEKEIARLKAEKRRTGYEPKSPMKQNLGKGELADKLDKKHGAQASTWFPEQTAKKHQKMRHLRKQARMQKQNEAINSPMKQKKSKEDYLNEGFSQEEADFMFKNQAVTGEPSKKVINRIRQIEAKYKWNPSDMPSSLKTELQSLQKQLKESK